MPCTECEYYRIYYEPLEYGGAPCWKEEPDCRLGREEGECELITEEEEENGS